MRKDILFFVIILIFIITALPKRMKARVQGLFVDRRVSSLMGRKSLQAVKEPTMLRQKYIVLNEVHSFSPFFWSCHNRIVLSGPCTRQ